MSTSNYLVIDVTTVEETKLLNVAPVRSAELYGRIYKAQGRNVIAPPLEGKGLSRLDQMQLSYLLWNTWQLTPPNDYGELLALVKYHAEQYPVDDTPLDSLQAYADDVCPQEPEDATESGALAGTVADAPVKKTRAKKATAEAKTAQEPTEAKVKAVKPSKVTAAKVEATPAGVPKSGTTTGRVWEIADTMRSQSRGDYPDRKEVLAKCEHEGINPSTASTQYAKWLKYRKAEDSAA